MTNSSGTRTDEELGTVSAETAAVLDALETFVMKGKEIRAILCEEDVHSVMPFLFKISLERSHATLAKCEADMLFGI